MGKCLKLIFLIKQHPIVFVIGICILLGDVILTSVAIVAVIIATVVVIIVMDACFSFWKRILLLKAYIPLKQLFIYIKVNKMYNLQQECY